MRSQSGRTITVPNGTYGAFLRTADTFHRQGLNQFHAYTFAVQLLREILPASALNCSFYVKAVFSGNAIDYKSIIILVLSLNNNIFKERNKKTRLCPKMLNHINI